MARSYQQYLSSLSTDELLAVQLMKLQEIARRQETMSVRWRQERNAEMALVRAEIRMRGEQLRLPTLRADDRAAQSQV